MYWGHLKHRFWSHQTLCEAVRPPSLKGISIPFPMSFEKMMKSGILNAISRGLVAFQNQNWTSPLEPSRWVGSPRYSVFCPTPKIQRDTTILDSSKIFFLLNKIDLGNGTEMPFNKTNNLFQARLQISMLQVGLPNAKLESTTKPPQAFGTILGVLPELVQVGTLLHNYFLIVRFVYLKNQTW